MHRRTPFSKPARFSHTLSYQGIADFVTPAHAEKVNGFWLVANLMAALSLLAAVFCSAREEIGHRYDYAASFAALAIAAHTAWAVLFQQASLPATFVPRQGLTPFKVYSEYLLVA